MIDGRKSITAKRSLGQNFLFNQQQLAKIVSLVGIESNNLIVEIGPGLGTLTDLIIKSPAQEVICLEKDERLYDILVKKFAEHKKVKILLQDVLKTEWETLIGKNSDKQVIIVGNLPYNISKEIIFKLVEKRNLFKKFVFLVQKEVAQRIVASDLHYKKNYSFLSIFISFFFDVELLANFDKKYFKPTPKVDGALVSFKVRKEGKFFSEELAKQKKFLSFLKNVFSHRRKTLFNNLKRWYFKEEEINQSFINLDLQKKIRPQDVSVSKYFKIFEMLNSEN